MKILGKVTVDMYNYYCNPAWNLHDSANSLRLLVVLAAKWLMHNIAHQSLQELSRYAKWIRKQLVFIIVLNVCGQGLRLPIVGVQFLPAVVSLSKSHSSRDLASAGGGKKGQNICPIDNSKGLPASGTVNAFLPFFRKIPNMLACWLIVLCIAARGPSPVA